MRRTWRSNRVILFLLSLLLCGGLIFVSASGLSSGVEGIAASPLNFVVRILNGLGLSSNEFVTDLTEVQSLRERNAELEEQLIRLQVELIDLREINNDYLRLVELLDYTTSAEDQEFVTADVIGVDQDSSLRSIIINRGTRDGLAIGMPVVTDLGLVGRIFRVSSNASQVQLITDQNSAISGRLQTTRVEGSVIGLLAGNLRMTFIPLGADIVEGDLVVTSGLGGNLPSDIVIGQVTSIRQFEFELYQEAEIRSLINFDTLEIVLVITSFEPVDLSIFEETEETQ